MSMLKTRAEALLESSAVINRHNHATVDHRKLFCTDELDFFALSNVYKYVHIMPLI